MMEERARGGSAPGTHSVSPGTHQAGNASSGRNSTFQPITEMMSGVNSITPSRVHHQPEAHPRRGSIRASHSPSAASSATISVMRSVCASSPCCTTGSYARIDSMCQNLPSVPDDTPSVS